MLKFTEVDLPLMEAEISRRGLTVQWLQCQRKWNLPRKVDLRLNQKMERFIGRFSPVVFALFRIVTGLLMACHGGQKILGMFGSEHVFPPLSFMGFGGLLELIGGFLVAFGLFGSVAAFLLSGEMAVAYFMVHAKGGFFPLVNRGESAVLYCFIFLYIACHGSGILSLDDLLFRRTASGPVVR